MKQSEKFPQEANMGSQNQPGSIPPGEMVDVGGFRLHAITCGQGSPTVIFEPAMGGFALQYAHIQSALAPFARVLTYERAGQAWSDPSPNPRTPANLAGELATLLAKLDLQPPYILAGHSFGGLLTRAYAGLHPAEVCGMVLIDAVHIDEYAPFPDLDKMIRQMALTARLLKFLGRLGLGKQLAKLSLGPAARTLSVEDLDNYVAATSRPAHYATMLAEYRQHRCYFGAQSEIPRNLGDIPLCVITAGKSVSGPGKIGGLTSEQMNALHQQLQQDLLHLSTRAEQVVIQDASHTSLLTQPEHIAQVVDAIHRMIATANTGA
jgi:pimeloyl-ACP methyl ester carboxylesterase